MKKCKIKKCEKDSRARGMCWKHYRRELRHGDSSFTQIRKPGTGQLTQYGLRRHTKEGDKFEHRLIVEKAIGRKLEVTEHIIHKDGDYYNNEIDNLRIKKIGSAAALEACGHSDWRFCTHCKTYDDPINLYIHGTTVYHRKCSAEYKAIRRMATK